MNLGLLYEISRISLKLGLVDLHLGFLLGMDVDRRLGHIAVMFKFIYLFFFSCRFDVHVLLFWVYFFILGLMSLLGYLFLIFFI